MYIYINMTDNMFEIDVDNNKNANNEFLGNQSKFLDPEVVDNLKMLLKSEIKLTVFYLPNYFNP